MVDEGRRDEYGRHHGCYNQRHASIVSSWVYGSV
jgi:hypothetical protein